MSVSGEYLVHSCLPEYSLALHVDLESPRELRHSVAVLKGTEDEKGYLTVSQADKDDAGAASILDRCLGTR